MSSQELVKDLYQFLPHGKELKTISDILEIKKNGFKVLAKISRSLSFWGEIETNDEKPKSLLAPVYVCTEYIAQTAALFQLYTSLKTSETPPNLEQTTSANIDLKPVKSGFVVAIKLAEKQSGANDFLELDQPIIIDIECSGKIANAYIVSGTVYDMQMNALLKSKLTLVEES